MPLAQRRADEPERHSLPRRAAEEGDSTEDGKSHSSPFTAGIQDEAA